MSDEPHLSVTQLKMYLRCPLQYFFRYECGVVVAPTGSMTLGRAVHQALNDNYRQKMQSRRDMPVSDMTDAFSDHWDREVQETLFEENEYPGELKDQGVGLLSMYHEKVAPGIQPVEVEKGFLLDTGVTDQPLKGYIDLIDDRGYIRDHKTSKRSFYQDTAEKDVQLTAYALAYRELYGQDENGVRLDVMVRTKTPRIQTLLGTRTQADIDRFKRLLEQVERGIQAELFYPNYNYMCGTCGYKQMCGEW